MLAAYATHGLAAAPLAPQLMSDQHLAVYLACCALVIVFGLFILASRLVLR